MLTVVIPTRNRQLELLNLVDKLLSFKNTFEIIVVDSSNTKNHDQIFTQNKRVRYFHTDIKSAAIQRNIGLNEISKECKYIAFLDDDVMPNFDYFDKLISLLKEKNAVGVSGFARNSKRLSSHKLNFFSDRFRRFFLLSSKNEGSVTKSGVNIAAKIRNSAPYIVKVDWLIGCSLWDFQVIQDLRFNPNFFGQSLGEDVLFSLQASSRGALYVDTSVILEHSESKVGRPSEFGFYCMWVRNRYAIVTELHGRRFQLEFHWSNLGKFLALTVTIFVNPIQRVKAMAGMFVGYYQIFELRNAS
jgi:glycosyltransferase involved in cell wall biosynthesis